MGQSKNYLVWKLYDKKGKKAIENIYSTLGIRRSILPVIYGIYGQKRTNTTYKDRQTCGTII